MNLSDGQLLDLWLQAKKDNGTSQRKLAKVLGMNFNKLHGRIFREQQRRLGNQEAPVPATPRKKTMFSAAVFDIECTDFETTGVRNHLICCSVLPLGGEVKTISISWEDERNDYRMLQEVWRELEKYDILIGHYVNGFDFNWLFSRTMYHGLPNPPKRWLVYDTYHAAKRIGIRSRKSLEFLIDYFQVEGEKTRILPVAWGNIDSPKKPLFEEALRDIVYHCERDVEANERLFYILWERDLMPSLPFTKRW